MEEFMNLKKGDIIKTALGEHTTVLDVKKNQVVLFTNLPNRLSNHATSSERCLGRSPK